jgi:cytochrome c-type biogenesis protein CcmE
MNKIHQRRIIFTSLIIGSVALAATLSLFALKQNINLFFSPTQVVAGLAPHGSQFRLGGIVKPGSIYHQPNSLTVSFIITDYQKNVNVNYTGILPDLFRDGQGVVVDGTLNTHGVVVASQVLAKHDESYMPATVKKMLKGNPST